MIIEKVWWLFSTKAPVHTMNFDANRQQWYSNKNKGVKIEEQSTTMAKRSGENKINGILLEEPTKAAAKGSNDNENKGAIIQEPTIAAEAVAEGSNDNIKQGVTVNKLTTTAAERLGAATTLEAEPLSSQIGTRNLKIFTFNELKNVTHNFRPSAMLEISGGESVYKGWVDGETYAPSISGIGIAVAVKMSNTDNVQSLKQWEAEVNWGKFSHPNLVKLLGYCSEDRLLLLVYEYMPKRNLENRLGRYPLEWGIMMKIAIGAAHGLAFLHTIENTIVYRTFKSSNVLLDEDFGATLYFGSTTFGRDLGVYPVLMSDVGTYRYAAPEYMATGNWYVKSDVYGFGAMMLDMIMGLHYLDRYQPASHSILVDRARDILSEEMELRSFVDQELERFVYPWLDKCYPSAGASKAAELILSCLEIDPETCPSMKEVVAFLEEINAIKNVAEGV